MGWRDWQAQRLAGVLLAASEIDPMVGFAERPDLVADYWAQLAPGGHDGETEVLYGWDSLPGPRSWVEAPVRSWGPPPSDGPGWV